MKRREVSASSNDMLAWLWLLPFLDKPKRIARIGNFGDFVVGFGLVVWEMPCYFLIILALKEKENKVTTLLAISLIEPSPRFSQRSVV
ncbi:MAG: hypothetical protein R6U57_00875 [Anaerolineales bacterium]